MKNIHLTDEEIQLYAIEAHSCQEALVEHIQHCEHCQQQVLNYQLLFEGIEAQEKAIFDFDVVGLVMEQLPYKKPAFDSPFFYAIASAVALIIVTIGYLFGNGLIGLFSYLQPVLIGLALLTTLGLMVFLGVDMYHRYKAQMKALNFY